MPNAGVSVGLLADHPDLVAAVGALRWREWGRAPEPEQLDWWITTTGREAGRLELPITWVAIDPIGRAVGAVGLGQFDIDERRDRSPWVIGTIVTEECRGTGIGRQLLGALEGWARGHGHSRVWVATGGPVVTFYLRCGWLPDESVHRSSGEEVSVLSKSL